VVEVLTAVAGVVSGQLAQGTNADASGRLRTRLLQVVAKQGDNVDVKPGIPCLNSVRLLVDPTTECISLLSKTSAG
jgi:hypothetical protein